MSMNQILNGKKSSLNTKKASDESDGVVTMVVDDRAATMKIDNMRSKIVV
jgi:hypothetical protein